MIYVDQLLEIRGDEVVFKLDEFPDIDRLKQLSDDGYLKAEIRFDDNRRITAEQRKKTWALIGDIAKHTGFNPIEAGDWMKAYYMAESGAEYFSLSNCSVTTARLFISYIIEFCFLWNIPFKKKGMEMHDDINAYVWLCIKYRKCVLCGQKADWHHIDAVGAGNNRKTVDHSSRRLIALCRRHHNEAHQIGKDTFLNKHHIDGIKLTKQQIKEIDI